MASQAHEAGAGHKLPEADESYKRAQRVQRAQWLRAAILGANDGLLSTTSLMLGVGAVKEDRWSMVLSGLAGALAGACSMAVGEFVSVSTQRDIEKSIGSSHSTSSKALNLEDAHEIKNLESGLPNSINHHVHEFSARASPLSSIRSPVMKVMTEEANEEDEDEALPSPYKAAAASAFAFLCGSLVPIVVAVLVAENMLRIVLIVVVASIALALSGAIGAHLGGSSVKVSAARVLVGGWMAMAVTYGLLKPLDRDDNGKVADKD